MLLSSRRLDSQDSSQFFPSRLRIISLNSNQSQSSPKFSNQQTINMFKILDRYTKPVYTDDVKLSPSLTKSDSQKKLPRQRSTRQLNQDQYDNFYYNSDTPRNINQGQRIQDMLEKELYSLKADVNRLKSIELKQNKKYQDQVLSIMQQNQRYPPPNVLFGVSTTPMARIAQPAFFF